MTQAYAQIPGHKAWLQDSSVLLKGRGGDRVLGQIDLIVDAMERSGESVRKMLLVDLFWALDRWLKVYRSSSKMDPRREPAIYRLYVLTATLLCRMMQCRVDALAAKLEYVFGRVQVDRNWQHWRQYASLAERRMYRVHFSVGLAYQFEWWVENFPVKNRALASGSGGFVMLGNREFLLMPEGREELAYEEDAPVVCRGRMVVRNGRVEQVRGVDGAAWNGEELRQALRMYQVDLRRVRIDDAVGVAQVHVAPVRVGWGWLARA